MVIISENRHLNSDNLEHASEILSEYEFFPISCINWPEKFPEKPQAGFRMAHNGTELFIRFTVKENSTLAKIKEDNGEVWTDSCVEFFLALDDTGYYNFEFTCIGKALLGFRKERPNAIHATLELMQTIKRFSTLGNSNFEEKSLKEPWELTVAIPTSALFRHQVQQWKGLAIKANLYKCGDHLSTPHFLSWVPIDTAGPDFHVPRCFTKMTFL